MLASGMISMLSLMLAAGLVAGFAGWAAALLLAPLRRRLGGLLWLGPLAAALLGLVVCAAGAGPGSRAVLALPLGLPGYGSVLALDGLSGFFLLACGLGLAAGLRLMEAPRPAMAAMLAGLFFSLLAADGFALLLGLASSLIALWRLSAAGRGVVFAGVAGLGALLLAMALLAPLFPDGSPNPAFAAMRGEVLPAARGAGVVALVLLGTGLIACPLLWPAGLARRAEREGAVIAAALIPLALYLVLRLAGDLAFLGAAPGRAVMLLLAGAALALGGARDAMGAATISRIASAVGLALLGEAVLGVGVAALARGADLSAAARGAEEAALLLALLATLAPPLLLLIAATLRAEAGTVALARLGGLGPRMPLTTAGAAVGASSLAALPPGPGYAAISRLVGTLFHLPLIGGVIGALGCAALVALLGLVVALGIFAMLRFLGMGFLGPPRTPRASAASESDRRARCVLGALAVTIALIGFSPGLALRLAAPAVAIMLPAVVAVPDAVRPGWLAFLAPPFLAALLAGIVALVMWLSGAGPRMQRPPTGWRDGYGPPPRWLPFGDPLILVDPENFAASWCRPERRLRATLARLTERPRAAWRAARAAWREG